MSDLVQRLRALAKHEHDDLTIGDEAADELDRLTRELEAARKDAALCQPSGLMFDALGKPRTRYVRVTLNRSHCVMHPSEGDRYVQDARDAGDDSQYTVTDVYLSEREFYDMPEFDGF